MIKAISPPKIPGQIRIGLLLTVFLFGACASTPNNLEGKNFDANSNYCRQLRSNATMVYRTNPRLHSNRSTATNPQSAAPRIVSQAERDASMRTYSVDCESINAYKLRI